MLDQTVNEVHDVEELPGIAQRLLVIDDDTVHRMVLTRVAKQAGYVVDEIGRAHV